MIIYNPNINLPTQLVASNLMLIVQKVAPNLACCIEYSWIVSVSAAAQYCRCHLCCLLAFVVPRSFGRVYISFPNDVMEPSFDVGPLVQPRRPSSLL